MSLPYLEIQLLRTRSGDETTDYKFKQIPGDWLVADINAVRHPSGERLNKVEAVLRACLIREGKRLPTNSELA